MKPLPSFILVATFLLSSCEAWGPRDNPADSKAGNYQGYETVTSLEAVKPAAADSGTVAFIPKLVALKVAMAQAYRFQISAAADFAPAKTYTSQECAINEYLPIDCTSLSEATKYYWRVQAKKDDSWGPWSTQAASFSLSAPAIVCASPVDGGGTVDKMPLLDWSDAAGTAAGYELQYANASACLAACQAVSATGSQYQMPSDLSLGQWYWRVRAKSSDKVWGAWSSTWSFTVSWPYTLTPSPTDAGTTSDTTPLLDWNDVAEAGGYELQYGSTKAGTEGSAAIAAASSQYQVPTGLALGKWYWRVRAKNADSVWGAWSSTWSFTIYWPYTLTPTPVDAGTTSDTTPLLDWNDVAEAAGYALQYGSTKSGAEGSAAIAVASSQYQVPTDLALGQWYWRVKAKNGDGVWGAWSSIWSFTIAQEFMAMVDVAGGTFTQGRQVTLSNFAIGKYEVTFDQYDAFCAATSRTQVNDSGWGRGSRPAINVTWYDAVAFCNWLSAKEGLQAAYTGSDTIWTLDRSKNGYRLPTEAEWEYAARGGASTHGYTYAGSDDLSAVAWNHFNSGDQTQIVGGKSANELGLYDMSGNAYEWTNDWFIANSSYSSSAETDPLGLSSGSHRVIRGGCWNFDDCAVSSRTGGGPSYIFYCFGFRVARTMGTKPLVSMVDVAGGTFTQGRQVTLSNFAIGKYELTFDQYDQYCHETGLPSVDDSSWGRRTRPIINVSWFDAVAFCNWLSRREGLQAAYTGSDADWSLDVGKNGYRLPTNAEWEYAARGGVSTHGYAYAGSSDVNAIAWYASNSGSMTQTVGGKTANELGLFDMSGNVAELNHDWYVTNYPSYAETDPLGPSSGSDRMLRGGSWRHSESYCAVVTYVGRTPSYSAYDFGFRIARSR